MVDFKILIFCKILVEKRILSSTPEEFRIQEIFINQMLGWMNFDMNDAAMLNLDEKIQWIKMQRKEGEAISSSGEKLEDAARKFWEKHSKKASYTLDEVRKYKEKLYELDTEEKLQGKYHSLPVGEGGRGTLMLFNGVIITIKIVIFFV
jgi:hypothetical protein